MVFSSSDVDRLLATTSALLPLSQADFRANKEACRMGLQDAAALFPNARHAPAALAGLLLRAGCWAESHAIAQDVASIEGSYWHGILHRMEPDSSNAGYWFRRVGKHAIFPSLLQRATEILDSGGPRHWRLQSTWNPHLFIEWCDEAREKAGPPEAVARAIQMVEWQLLFEWCSAI